MNESLHQYPDDSAIAFLLDSVEIESLWLENVVFILPLDMKILQVIFKNFYFSYFQERLRLHMVQEWCRAEQSAELTSKEKGPISAISALYYQKDDKYRKLVSFSNLHLFKACPLYGERVSLSSQVPLDFLFFALSY